MPVAKGTDRRLLGRLPAFSPIAVRLMSALGDERTSFKEIARLITLDPVLAAEVLQLANSALYGRRFEVRSVLHAIAMLGFQKLSQIAMTAALWLGLPSRTRSSPFVRDWWRHSIAAALIARRHSAESPLDFAYTAALLHGVGQLAMFEEAPRDYPVLVESAYAGSHDLMAAERAAFHVDHASLAGLLLESWGLPETLCEAAARHDDVSADTRLLLNVQLGCLGAEYAGFGRCGCHQRLAAGVPDQLADLLATDFTVDMIVAGVNEVEVSLG